VLDIVIPLVWSQLVEVLPASPSINFVEQNCSLKFSCTYVPQRSVAYVNLVRILETCPLVKLRTLGWERLAGWRMISCSDDLLTVLYSLVHTATMFITLRTITSGGKGIIFIGVCLWVGLCVCTLTEKLLITKWCNSVGICVVSLLEVSRFRCDLTLTFDLHSHFIKSKFCYAWYSWW